MRKRASHNGGGILFHHNGQKERNPARPAYEVDFAVDGYYIDVQHQQRRDYEFCKTCVKPNPLCAVPVGTPLQNGRQVPAFISRLLCTGTHSADDIKRSAVLCGFGDDIHYDAVCPWYYDGGLLLSSTSVSEFIGSMERMHLTEKIVIPLSVIFRFFPTISEEYQAISDAMKMRGIRFGGKNPFLMVEYRLVPLMVSVVKIGDELSAAALTRGLGAPVKRTNVCQIGFHVQDMIVILLCALCFALFLLGQYFSF